MAVDKVFGPNSSYESAMFNSRISLEDALDRFDEQVSQHSPEVIRQRLKRGLADFHVNLTGRFGEED